MLVDRTSVIIFKNDALRLETFFLSIELSALFYIDTVFPDEIKLASYHEIL